MVVRAFFGPYGFGPSLFRVRLAYGPGFFGARFYDPFRPAGFVLGLGPRFGWGDRS